MNITVEDLAPCRKRLRIEVPANRVTEEFEKVASEYAKLARIPGFRQGKAPKNVIVKKYQKDIEQELQRNLVPQAYREACEKRQIEAVTQPNIEDLNYQHGLSLSFSTIVETAPEFQLPNYKGLTVTVPANEVSDQEVTEAIEKALSSRAALIEVTDRPVQLEDIAVVKFTGTIDGKLISEVPSAPQQLGTVESQWLLVRDNAFIPGFATQLVGMNIGDQRTIKVTLPMELSIEQLKGQEAEYTVELKGLKIRQMPEVTDELAQELVQAPAAEFQTKIRESLLNQKARQQRHAIQRQIAEQLELAVQFPLPETLVEVETRGVIDQIISENQNRGISVNSLEEKKQEIFDNAARSAKETVKLNFILSRIGEVEKIRVGQNELGEYVSYLSMQYGTPVEKLVKQLREGGGFSRVMQELLSQKVMDFLVQQANVITQ